VKQLEHEITRSSSLLDERGRLVQTGWARHPLLDCNLEAARFYRILPAQRFRIKRWDYYGVTAPDLYFSATLADLGYAGQVFVYVVDFATGTHHEETITVPLGRGITLARNSDRGESRYDGRNVRARFAVEGDLRRVEVRWADFGGRPLAADLQFRVPTDHESTVVVIPIGERRFYYNRKINCLPASGELRIGDQTTRFDPATSLGNLDWGRGVWEYNSFWVWASASGLLADGRPVGLNMGFGFGDTSAANENTMLLAGRIHKIPRIEIEYDPRGFMHPWTMRSDRVDLTFAPFLERTAKTNLLLIRSEVHQMFGRYSGTVVADTGESVVIDGLVGWAEEHNARW
jgi:hypothetical protein